METTRIYLVAAPKCSKLTANRCIKFHVGYEMPTSTSLGSRYFDLTSVSEMERNVYAALEFPNSN